MERFQLPNDFEAEVTILVSNLKVINLNRYNFTKFSEGNKQVSILSRQIAEKIEANHISSINDKVSVTNSCETSVTPKSNFTLKNDHSQTKELEKAIDTPVLNR